MFAPDGSWIAFASTGSHPEPIGLGDLYVVPAMGGEAFMLMETPNRSASIVGWSGDSREIFLAETLGVTRQLIAVPVEPLKGELLRLEMPGPRLSHDLAWAGAAVYQKPDGLVWAGTTVTSKPCSTSWRRMLRLMPKS